MRSAADIATGPGRWRRRIARGLAWSAAGVAIGLAGTWVQLKSAKTSFGQAAGPWRFSLLAGSPHADLLTRARVAVGGLLALDRRETLYYVATQDSAGRPLRSRCHWRISGPVPPARWWSLTAYADDHFLFEHPARRYSVNGATTPLDGQGRFSVVTGPSAPAGHTGPWLPTPGDRGLVLTLRAYNPEDPLARDPAALPAPRIDPVGDCP